MATQPNGAPAKGRKPLLSQLAASASIAPAITSVTSWTFALCCALGAGLSLATFTALGNMIVGGALAAGYKGNVSDLEILDVRDGYIVTQVDMLMDAWGLRGRLLYLLIELIDVAIFCTCYRGLFVVLFNRMAGGVARRWPAAKPVLRWAAVGPVLLAGWDYLEDASQVTVTVAYSLLVASGRAPPQGAWWEALVLMAATLNRLKWVLLKTVLVPFIALLAAQLPLLALGSPREPKAGKKSQ